MEKITRSEPGVVKSPAKDAEMSKFSEISVHLKHNAADEIARRCSFPSVQDNNRAVASRVPSNRTCSSFTREKRGTLGGMPAPSQGILFPGSVTAVLSIYEPTVPLKRGKNLWLSKRKSLARSCTGGV